MRYVQVVIENKSRHTDSFFTYRYDEPDESEEKRFLSVLCNDDGAMGWPGIHRIQ